MPEPLQEFTRVGTLAEEMKKRAREQNVQVEIDATADAVRSSK